MSQKRSSYMIEKVGIDFDERRVYRRAPGRLADCVIRGDDGPLADCVLLDISASGARIRFDAWPEDEAGVSLKPGHRLEIAAAVDLQVEVVWQDGPVFGLCCLNDPQEVAVALEHMLPQEIVHLRDPSPGAEPDPDPD